MTGTFCVMVRARFSARLASSMDQTPVRSSSICFSHSVILLAVFHFTAGLHEPLFANNDNVELQAIFAAQAEIQSLQSHFIQTKSLSLFEDTLVSEGTIVIEKPDFYCWVYEQPERSVFYVNGGITGSLDPVTGQREETSLENSKGLASIIQSITPIVSGNLSEATRSEYRIIRDPASGDLMSYSFHPRQQELQSLFDKVTIRFDPSSRLARDLTINEKNGDSTTVVFAEWQINIPVDRSLLVD